MNTTKTKTTTDTTDDIPDELGLAGRRAEYTDDSGHVHRATIRGTIVESRDRTRVLPDLDDGGRIETDRPSDRLRML